MARMAFVRVLRANVGRSESALLLLTLLPPELARGRSHQPYWTSEGTPSLSLIIEQCSELARLLDKQINNAFARCEQGTSGGLD
jgi:hypothetical protein